MSQGLRSVTNASQADSSSHPKKDGIPGRGASAPSVNDDAGGASEPSKASDDKSAASPSVQLTDATKGAKSVSSATASADTSVKTKGTCGATPIQFERCQL